VNSEKGVNYSAEKKSAELPAIFDWYKDDFKGEGGPASTSNAWRAMNRNGDCVLRIGYQRGKRVPPPPERGLLDSVSPHFFCHAGQNFPKE
jgi:hypothetical protein